VIAADEPPRRCHGRPGFVPGLGSERGAGHCRLGGSRAGAGHGRIGRV